ncbi:GIY-YIG nuclease family protein [candidate division KSB1 bacterium]
MYSVYILQSQKDRSYYIGQTSNIADRIKRHNEGRVKSTKLKRPWELVFYEEFSTRNESMHREKQIKSYKGGEAFRKLFNSSC